MVRVDTPEQQFSQAGTKISCTLKAALAAAAAAAA